MVFTPPTNFSLFKKRRQSLVQEIKHKYGVQKGIILIGAGFETDRYAFRQESSFYYLTGIAEPAVMLCILLDGPEILYVPHFATPRSQWTAVSVEGPKDAPLVGIDQIRYLGQPIPGYSFRPVFAHDKYADLLKDLQEYFAASPQASLFTILDSSRDGYLWHIDTVNHFTTAIPTLQKNTIDIAPLIHDARRIKDEYEIDLIYKAIQITNLAHKAIASLIKKDAYEYELLAAVECVFTQVAAAPHAFPPIIATGKNTTILHYTQCHQQLKPGDLVVIDIGAEYGLYAADLTRTFPVNGIFSPRQREIYNIVLDAQAYIESIAYPGMYLKNPKLPEKSLHHLAVKFFEKHNLAQYFCHGIGHYLGLDVHDTGSLAEPLLPGDVFTLEPGIYIAEENIGIRIEDNYVMADDGAVCLSYELPKLADEIEQLMKT